MKVLIFLCVAALVLPGLGCQEDSGITPSAKVQVPEPEVVPYSNIPNPPTPAMYRISGQALADGPVQILKEVEREGFDLKRAWRPKVYLCMALFLDELIVELEQPDDGIYELGFTSDFSGTAGPCASHWDEYRFAKK